MLTGLCRVVDARHGGMLTQAHSVKFQESCKVSCRASSHLVCPSSFRLTLGLHGCRVPVMKGVVMRGVICRIDCA